MSLQVVKVEDSKGLIGVEIVHGGHVDHFHAIDHSSSDRHVGPLMVESSADEPCRRVILDSDEPDGGD